MLSRRTMLKGMGTLVALPRLEALMPAKVAPGGPARMAFLFVPNGINMEHWRPGAAGALGELPHILKPLDPVKGNLNVLTGLAQHNAHALGDGPGDHARSSAAWLTGVHPKKTSGADIQAGISADQVAAQVLQDKTKFASLELGCEGGRRAGDCDSGYACAYSNSISWRSPETPNAKEVSPRLMFERLFGSGDALEEEQSRARRAERRKSILDFVMEEAGALKSKLGGRDQQKLDEYLESVRDVERRLERAEASEAAQMPAGATMPDPGIPRDRGEHIRLMGDMMILAFQADLTRVATFMFANEGSNRPYREIDITGGHHDISHHGKDPNKLASKKAIDRYHAEQLAYILKRMSEIEEPNGSMLDNSMVVYGGGISDGDRHNHNDLPTLIAGGAGGKLPGGRHLVFPERTPMNNLFLSMLDWMGADVEQLGDSTGKLQGLF